MQAIIGLGFSAMQAIMMIEDETGTLALLGRPKKLRNGVLTCLSGFIEQVCFRFTFLHHPQATILGCNTLQTPSSWQISAIILFCGRGLS
jgi:hypothetical protein